jgi:hypothetical protein
MSIIRTIAFDWKESTESVAEQLKPLLKEFGVYVYDNPATEGSDEVGLLFSDHELTRDQINEICEDY